MYNFWTLQWRRSIQEKLPLTFGPFPELMWSNPLSGCWAVTAAAAPASHRGIPTVPMAHTVPPTEMGLGLERPLWLTQTNCKSGSICM